MRPVTAAALAATLIVGLVACGASSVPSPSPAPSAPAVVDPGPPIDIDALVATAAVKDGQAVRVTGFFLAADGKAQLCSLTLESYPPQCGGGTVRLIGEVPRDVLDRLDKTSDPALAQATWGSVSVLGTFRSSGADGLPTVEIDEIAINPAVG